MRVRDITTHSQRSICIGHDFSTRPSPFTWTVMRSVVALSYLVTNCVPMIVRPSAAVGQNLRRASALRRDCVCSNHSERLWPHHWTLILLIMNLPFFSPFLKEKSCDNSLSSPTFVSYLCFRWPFRFAWSLSNICCYFDFFLCSSGTSFCLHVPHRVLLRLFRFFSKLAASVSLGYSSLAMSLAFHLFRAIFNFSVSFTFLILFFATNLTDLYVLKNLKRASALLSWYDVHYHFNATWSE